MTIRKSTVEEIESKRVRMYTKLPVGYTERVAFQRYDEEGRPYFDPAILLVKSSSELSIEPDSESTYLITPKPITLVGDEIDNLLQWDETARRREELYSAQVLEIGSLPEKYRIFIDHVPDEPTLPPQARK
jgi:hypothetical protein